MNPGDRIEKYILEERINEGGMGEVWKARHERLDRPVVIKTILPSLIDKQGEIAFKRFEDEAKAQGALNHPNIVRVSDFFPEGGRFYLVLDYVEGEDLHHRIYESGRGLTVDEALAISRQILDALDYAHRKGVIHRDLKPENILLDRAGKAYLTDFGIALRMGQVTGGIERLTSGSSIGTPTYMSPEQIKKPLGVDHRTDVYSFGCVLYEMLCGRPPFTAEAEENWRYIIQEAHCHSAPPSPSSLSPAVDLALEAVVLKAMEKSPEDRFLGCGEFGEALDALQSGRNRLDAENHYRAGRQFQFGEGVPRDPGKALLWYRKAAQSGHLRAQYDLATMLMKGEGVPKDLAEAARWYSVTAEQGLAEGQYQIGRMYEDGRGVPKNQAEAMKWYLKSAEQGFSNAECELGYMYRHGSGVAPDILEAIKWYKKSSEHGNAIGQFNLGSLYENGDGVLKDLEAAISFYRMASNQGDEHAKAAIDRIEKEKKRRASAPSPSGRSVETGMPGRRNSKVHESWQDLREHLLSNPVENQPAKVTPKSAIVSAVLGVLSVAQIARIIPEHDGSSNVITLLMVPVFCGFAFLPILAMVTSVMAIQKIVGNQASYKGRAVAVVGFLSGLIGLIMNVRCFG